MESKIQTKQMFIAFINDDDTTKSGNFQVIEYLPGVHIIYIDHVGKKNTVMAHRLIKIKEEVDV